MPTVSIIFIYYNTYREIIDAIKSVKNAVGRYPYEVIIINNNSPIKPPYKEFNSPRIKIVENDKNIGYGSALNQGAKLAKGKYLLLSNPDLLFLKDSISLMVKKLEKDASVGIIGPQFLDLNQKIQKVGSAMPFLPGALFAFSFFNKYFPRNYFSRKYYLEDFNRKEEREIPALCGACMLVKENVFKKIGGFDKRFFMYFEEADICYRVVNIGYKVLFYPKSKVILFVGRSSGDKKWIRETFEKSRYEFFKKYHGNILGTLGELTLRVFNLPSKLISKI